MARGSVTDVLNKIVLTITAAACGARNSGSDINWKDAPRFK